MMKFLMSQKLKQDDEVTDHYVNQSRKTENDTNRVTYQVKVHQKVQTTLLFDTGADANVMSKYVWDHLESVHCKQQG